MTGWQQFVWYGAGAVLLWLTGAALAFRRPRAGSALFLAGTFVLALFIVLYWHSLGRPPMRTMGETRLWYSFCIAATGWVLHLRWRYRFLLPFAAVLAAVFTLVNILNPAIHSAALMPALRSAWFVPHVAVYMVAYALSTASLLLFAVSFRKGRNALRRQSGALTRAGSALLILGMLMGAVWARQAWGTYWAWDAKECWAAATWLLYLAHIHYFRRFPERPKTAFLLLLAAFAALQITWYGVDYLPAAEKSLHTYTQIR